jgi:uncharacterized protein
LGLSKEDNLFLVRFAAFNAAHDTSSQNMKKKEFIPIIKEKLDKKGCISFSKEIKSHIKKI